MLLYRIRESNLFSTVTLTYQQSETNKKMLSSRPLFPGPENSHLAGYECKRVSNGIHSSFTRGGCTSSRKLKMLHKLTQTSWIKIFGTTRTFRRYYNLYIHYLKLKYFTPVRKITDYYPNHTISGHFYKVILFYSHGKLVS